MSDPAGPTQLGLEFLFRTLLYREHLLEEEEISRHKWLESEKAGCDIGLAQARIDWIARHKTQWLAARSGRWAGLHVD